MRTTSDLGNRVPECTHGPVHEKVWGVPRVVSQGIDIHDVAGTDHQSGWEVVVEVAPEAGADAGRHVVCRRG